MNTVRETKIDLKILVNKISLVLGHFPKESLLASQSFSTPVYVHPYPSGIV